MCGSNHNGQGRGGFLAIAGGGLNFQFAALFLVYGKFTGQMDLISCCLAKLTVRAVGRVSGSGFA